MAIRSHSNISANLRALMRRASINEAQLARKSNVPQPTINRILSGNTRYPRGDTLKELANFFAIDMNVLLGNAPVLDNRLPGAYNQKNRAWELVPELTWEIAPDSPKARQELQKHGWKDWISTDAKVSENAFALSAQGEAMAPYFIEGTKLIIDLNVTPKDRDFVIVCTQGQSKATLKQLFYDGDIIYLKPLNPAFRMTEMSEKDRVLGVAVQAKIDFRED